MTTTEARKVTLFTGQWADLSLRALAEKAREEYRAEAPAGAYRLGQIEKWLAGR